MRQDITDAYLANLMRHMQLPGSDVLEIGCGAGRITVSLAGICRHVIAVDTDRQLVEKARKRCADSPVTFHVVSGSERLPFPERSFDVVIYSLSLHHLPPQLIVPHLMMTTSLLRPEGVVAIIEPAEGGSFTFAKEYFGAGSGNERKKRVLALQALRKLEGWRRSLPIPFEVTWQFDSPEEFITALVPHWPVMTHQRQNELLSFLERHRCDEGILLNAGRVLIILTREPQ